MITLRNASPSASSVPGRSCSQMSDFFATTVSRGSIVMICGLLSSDSRTLKRVSPSGPECGGLWPQYMIIAGGVPPVKSQTGRSPIVWMHVFTRGWKHCANPGSHQFGVPSALPKRETQRM